MKIAKIMKGKKVLLGIGTGVLPLVMTGAIFFGANNIRPSKASAHSLILNHGNAPTLVNHAGNKVDEHNVTWEYYNANDNASGHISLDHQGYFGVSSSTDWGYTGIDSLTVTFSKGTNGELWLLTSINGTDWEEGEILTSGLETHTADNWRFVRFYYWDEDHNSADITSVNIGYQCTGTDFASAADDPDLAQLSHLRRADDLNVTKETTIVSPRCGSTQALRLTETNGRTSSTTHHEMIFNIPSGTLEKYQNYKIEFDYYYIRKRDPKKTPGYPSLKLANGNTPTGAQKGINTAFDGFTVEEIKDGNGNKTGWWHLECYITYIMQLAENKLSTAITGITIYDDGIYEHDRDGAPFEGFAIIDNFFLTNHERSGCVTNSWTTVKIGATGNDRYFVRENFCGSVHSVSYSSSDTSVATVYTEAKQGNLLCYIEGLAPGDIVITITYKLGYDRKVVVVQTKTLTVES